MSRGEWEAQISQWLQGPEDNLIGLRELLLGDEDFCEDDDTSVMAEAETRIEDVIGTLEATPLNLKRIKGWLSELVLAAGYERLLAEDFRPLLTAEEREAILAEGRKNFRRSYTASWS